MSDIKASEAALICGGEFLGPDIKINRIWRSDSREINPNEAFVAIKGARVDGHMFIRDAINRGAKLLLIEAKEMKNLAIKHSDFSEITFIAVENTVLALATLSQSYLKKTTPRVIAITGSVGKTTTRELIISVLRERYRVHGAIRSFNTIIGCSLTVLSMPHNTDILVLEFGTNRPGEIAEMAHFFSPQTAVITSVAAAHLEELNSIEGVLKAKLEICSSTNIENVIINGDNPLITKNIQNCYKGDVISVGYDKNASLRIVNAKMILNNNTPSLQVEYLQGEKTLALDTSLFGLQHAYNVGYAVLVGELYGVSEEELKKSLKKSRAVEGRGVLYKINNETWLVDESYNANPSSMEAALDNVSNLTENYGFVSYAILGGMKELGEYSTRYHNEIIKKLNVFNKVFLLGEEWSEIDFTLYPNILYFKTYEKMLEQFELLNISQGLILIKGSNSYGLARVVKVLEGG